MKNSIVLSIAFLFVATALGAQVREIPVTRSTPQRIEQVPGVAGHPGWELSDRVHVLIGENAGIDARFLAEHDRNSGGGPWGDQLAIPADFWYDATHRRVFMRSLHLNEVDDPAEITIGRVPGVYPNEVAVGETLPVGTVTGFYSFELWDGYGMRKKGHIEGVVLEDGLMGVCIAMETGRDGRNRAGSTFTAEEEVCHVMILPDGSLVVGYNSDPAHPPNVYIRGNLVVEGRIEERVR